MKCKICGLFEAQKKMRVCSECIKNYSLFTLEKFKITDEDAKILKYNTDIARFEDEYKVNNPENRVWFFYYHQRTHAERETYVRFKNITAGIAGLYVATNSDFNISETIKNTYVIFNYRNLVITKIDLNTPEFKKKYKYIINISGQIQGSDNIYDIKVPVYANEKISDHTTEYEYIAFEQFLLLWNRLKTFNNEMFYFNYNKKSSNLAIWSYIKDAVNASLGGYIPDDYDSIVIKERLKSYYFDNAEKFEDAYYERHTSEKRKSKNNDSKSQDRSKKSNTNSNARNKNISGFEQKLQLFGLRNDYTKSELKRAYRKLIKKYHPDNAKNEKERAEFEVKIKEINVAHDYLSNFK